MTKVIIVSSESARSN